MNEHKSLLSFAKKKVVSLFKRTAGNLTYHICSLFYAQDKLILYSSAPNDGFGNIASLEKWFDAHRVKYLKLTQKMMIESPISFFLRLASARVLVIDAGSPASRVALNTKTELIHCWHAGGAYKKIGFDAKRKGIEDYKEEKRIKRIHRCISYFVCTSTNTAEIYAKAFRLHKSKMLAFGLPRLDKCLSMKSYTSPDVYTVLYAPTYRTKATGERYLPHDLDMHLLKYSLTKCFGESICFAFRGHPTIKGYTIEGWEDWSDISQDEALRKASVLITDYSSVFFDFLPYSRPIVFYVPDIEDYQKNERELYFSPYDEFPETTCGDLESLIEILVRCKSIDVDYTNFWNKHMLACDGKSTERLCGFILERMKRSMI